MVSCVNAISQISVIMMHRL